MYPHNLRAPTSPTKPRATGVCDRCYFYYYLDDLKWQFDWRGNALQNLRIRVCQRCLDDPQPQLRPVIIRGPEGVVRDPRPPQYQLNAQGGGPQYVPPNPIDGD